MVNEECKLGIILFDIEPCCLEDEDGKYFLYCPYHPEKKGFLRKDKAEDCMRKKCKNYKVYREEELNR